MAAGTEGQNDHTELGVVVSMNRVSWSSLMMEDMDDEQDMVPLTRACLCHLDRRKGWKGLVSIGRTTMSMSKDGMSSQCFSRSKRIQVRQMNVRMALEMKTM